MAEIPSSLRVGEVLALALGFGTSTLAVCARMYTKIWLTGTVLKEDYFSVLSWLFFLVYVALAVVIGRSDGSIEHITYLSYIEAAVYGPIIVAVKISILLQYITLFVTRRRTAFYYAVHGVLWTNVVYYTILSLLDVFECNPRRKYWNPTTPGHCFSRDQLPISSGVVNILSDFSILILPLPVIWRLQMSWAQRSRVTAVFGVGLFACIASIMRLVYSVELTRIQSINATHQIVVDKEGLWAFAELAIGIIVGCLPVLPRFFKHFRSRAGIQLSRSGILSTTSWRRLFRRSTTPKMRSKNFSYYNQKVFGKEKSLRSRDTMEAPYIETLNPTRVTFPSVDVYVPKVPSQARHSQVPPQARHPQIPPQARRKVYSTVAPWTATTHTKREEYEGYGNINGIERAILAPWT